MYLFSLVVVSRLSFASAPPFKPADILVDSISVWFARKPTRVVITPINTAASLSFLLRASIFHRASYFTEVCGPSAEAPCSRRTTEIEGQIDNSLGCFIP